MEVLEYSGLILWLIYLFLFIKREVRRKNKYSKEYTKELIIKKPFHIMRIDSLFFFIVYYVYTDFADSRVLPYLYLIIVITNIVYVSYDIADNLKPYKSKNGNDLKYYSGVIVLGIVAFIYMIISKDLFNTCTLTLGLNLLVPAYVWIIKIITTKTSGA